LIALSRSRKNTTSGAMMRPRPIVSTNWMTIARGKNTASQCRGVGKRIANRARTGMLARNSIPFESTSRLTQMVRGIFVDRMRRASRRNARVQSPIAPLNHIHGRSAESRKTIYGCSPTVRSKTRVKTNQ
jgi:hypothetical protein